MLNSETQSTSFTNKEAGALAPDATSSDIIFVDEIAEEPLGEDMERFSIIDKNRDYVMSFIAQKEPTQVP
jgi:hypothetical protein